MVIFHRYVNVYQRVDSLEVSTWQNLDVKLVHQDVLAEIPEV